MPKPDIDKAFPPGTESEKNAVIHNLDQRIQTLEKVGKSQNPDKSGSDPAGSHPTGSDSVGGSGDALPDDIRESIAIANAKSVAEQPSMLSNLAFANLLTNGNLSQQNTLSNQQAMNQLAVTVVGNAVNRVSDLSPMEAIAVNKLDTGDDVAQHLADLKAVTKA